MRDGKPHILILTDGKMGDLVQCRGIAAALTAPDLIKEEELSPGWVTALPLPNMPISAVDRQLGIFSLGVDIVIASGRRMLPYLRAFKNLVSPSPMTVFLKDPKFNHLDIDLIWAPSHDNLRGENVISTLTSPHTLTAEMLADESKSTPSKFASLPNPRTGIILGGNSKAVQWNQDTSKRFANCVAKLPPDSGLIITASRRTPDILKSTVRQALDGRQAEFLDATSDISFFDILAACDRLVLTGDSHNMMSEALATGAPVHFFRPPGLHTKLQWFLDTLESQQLAFNVEHGFSQAGSTPLNATVEIATEIQKKFDQFRPDS